MLGKQHPVEEAGVVDTDPRHQTEGQPKALPKGLRSGNQGAGQQDTRKEQYAEALRFPADQSESNHFSQFPFHIRYHEFIAETINGQNRSLHGREA